MLLFIVQTLLAACLSDPSTPGPDWCTDFRTARALAEKTRKPIVLVFTIDELCPVCRELDEKVFASPVWAERLGSRLVHLRLAYSRASSGDRSKRVLAASARLRGYPTLYVLDSEGWPIFALHGYDGDPAATLVERIEKALVDLPIPAAYREGGQDGLRKLLAWSKARDLPLGETLAAALLFPNASTEEKARFAPWLAAAEVARGGLRCAQGSLAAAKAYDPNGALGPFAESLFAAASQALRRSEWADAASCLETVIALPSPPARLRLDAEMSLGYAYRKLEAPCLARRHYAAAAQLATEKGTRCAEAALAQARASLDAIEPCDDGCGCASRRVSPR